MANTERQIEALRTLLEMRNKEITVLKETIDDLNRRIEALLIDLGIARQKNTELQSGHRTLERIQVESLSHHIYFGMPVSKK